MLYYLVCIIISNRVIGKLNSILQALGPYNNQRRSQLGRLSKQDCNGMCVALQHETLTRDGTEKWRKTPTFATWIGFSIDGPLNSVIRILNLQLVQIKSKIKELKRVYTFLFLFFHIIWTCIFSYCFSYCNNTRNWIF